MKDKFKKKMKDAQAATSSFGDKEGIHPGAHINFAHDTNGIYDPLDADWLKPHKESQNIAAF